MLAAIESVVIHKDAKENNVLEKGLETQIRLVEHFQL